MGKVTQASSKAKRAKDVAAREEKKSRVKVAEPSGSSREPGVSLDVPAEMLKQHQDSMSDFREQVYLLTQRIPKGKVATYGTMAGSFLATSVFKLSNAICFYAILEVLGSSPRAVGGALRNNPFAPIVPCHRVVASTGAMNGFAGATEGPLIQKKMDLLKSEGVRLDFAAGDGRVPKTFLLSSAELFTLAGGLSPSKSPKH